MSQSLIIYGHPLSQPSRSVTVFCKLSQIPFEFMHIEILTSHENFSEAFSAINPYQEVPAISHNGFNLWESGSIVSYLADAYLVDNQWYPKDTAKRGRVNAYLHWHHQGVRIVLGPYIKAKVVNPMLLGKKPLTEAEEAPFIKKTETMLKTLDWVLKKAGFIAMTESPTIADVFLYSELANAAMIGIDFKKYQFVNKWFEVIRKIPEVHQEHLQLYSFLKNFEQNPKI